MPKFLKIVKKAEFLVKKSRGRCLHFSAILHRNKILSVGINQCNKTHAFAKRNNYQYYFIHSELDAVKNFPYPPNFLRKCVLVNIRISRDFSSLLNSYPCLSCTRLINSLEFKSVWYSTNEGFIKL